MRIFLELEAEKDFVYDSKYYHKVQGFIYNLIKETELNPLHDKKSYKFFCFSNIFPIGDIKKGDLRKLIISSPNESFISILEKKIRELQEKGEKINFGESLFKIKKISVLKVKIPKKATLISATPIIIRIPERNYEKYGIDGKIRKKRYLYWRPEYPFDAFVKQLEENLFKKYNEFYGTKIEEFPIFEQFEFKKSVVSHIVINGKEYKLVGSVWEFMFSFLGEKEKEILEFGVDCGFGERNSFGFGFMNIL
ncbi:MAG: CRISPR-associated endoribonuclease Cas6 [archaeon]